MIFYELVDVTAANNSYDFAVAVAGKAVTIKALDVSNRGTETLIVFNFVTIDNILWHP